MGMAPETGVELQYRQNGEFNLLQMIVHTREYRRAITIRMRNEGTHLNAVAEQFAVSRQPASK